MISTVTSATAINLKLIGVLRDGSGFPGDRFMAASYTVNGDAFVADKPRVWIAVTGAALNPNMWDLAPDGKRVLIAMPAGNVGATNAAHHVVFVQNFFDELRRRVPLRK